MARGLGRDMARMRLNRAPPYQSTLRLRMVGLVVGSGRLPRPSAMREGVVLRGGAVLRAGERVGGCSLASASLLHEGEGNLGS